MKLLKFGLASAAVAGILVASCSGATASIGLRSYTGDNYSVDWKISGDYGVTACDEESDAHGVHADYLTTSSGSTQQVRDGNGANNACEASGDYSSHVYKHRAVEEWPVTTDQFGPWKYPS
ncbi:hypothetical protein [Luteimicrobium subarcticum]|uniref:Lipoprotein n=1 Tax=Luteimicrobium subarcticum TaxID=620910 RepID=A0A2M8WJB7_9MICO|nr:hypothetical protein [Luteimicrobium subarcticum]PJI91025.1 hypothetical protein CLV34_2284 [Luteimicrobium subarcticum]